MNRRRDEKIIYGLSFVIAFIISALVLSFVIKEVQLILVVTRVLLVFALIATCVISFLACLESIDRDIEENEKAYSEEDEEEK